MSPQRMVLILLMDVIGIGLGAIMWFGLKLGLYSAIPIVVATILQFVLAIRFRKEQ
jgi:hypothetical protein